MGCNNCQKQDVVIPPQATRAATLGPAEVSVLYTGGPPETIWRGLRAAIPADCNSVTIDDDGTIRYTQKGLSSIKPLSPPEGFQIVEEGVFAPTWPTCRARVFIAQIRECGLHVNAVCMEPSAEAFGAAVSCATCKECLCRKPIEVIRPSRRQPPHLPEQALAGPSPPSTRQ